MNSKKSEFKRGLLDPVERISEVIFGLIMALTFTCTLSASGVGREEVRTMIFGALGCNLAWGLVDGFMFVITSFIERARGFRLLHAIKNSPDVKDAQQFICEALPQEIPKFLKPDEIDALNRQPGKISPPTYRPKLTREDLLGALSVFFLVFISTFPVVIPFIVIQEPEKAVRVSNAIALLLLFTSGYSLGRYADYRPWLMGGIMACIGSILVVLTIALGG